MAKSTKRLRPWRRGEKLRQANREAFVPGGDGRPYIKGNWPYGRRVRVKVRRGR